MYENKKALVATSIASGIIFVLAVLYPYLEFNVYLSFIKDVIIDEYLMFGYLFVTLSMGMLAI